VTGGFWNKLDQAGRNLTPAAVTMMLMLAGMVPLHLPLYGSVAPMLSLMSVYYWAIHRPDLLRPSIAFLIGVFQDLLGGLPLGVTALLFVSAYWLLISQRRFFLGTSFMMLWWGFTVVALGAGLVQWAAFCLLTLRLLPPAPALVQAALTLSLFPVFAWIFVRVHRAFLQV
jgi:rod shape-determining protein MreD